MKQKDAVLASLAVKKLNQQAMPCAIAIQIFNLMQKLKPALDFQIQEEEKLKEKYPRVAFVSTQIQIKDEADKEAVLAEIKAFNEEATTLAEMECEDIDFEPIMIHLSELPRDLMISGEDIGALKNFIIFE